MTQPQAEADAKEVLHDVTIGDVTVQVRPTDEKLYTAMRVRLQIAEKRGTDEAAANATVGVLADVIGKLVPDEEQVDQLVGLLATGEVEVDEMIQKICMAGANREERRAAGAGQGAARREPVAGRNRRGGRRGGRRR